MALLLCGTIATAKKQVRDLSAIENTTNKLLLNGHNNDESINEDTDSSSFVHTVEDEIHSQQNSVVVSKLLAIL